MNFQRVSIRLFGFFNTKKKKRNDYTDYSIIEIQKYYNANVLIDSIDIKQRCCHWYDHLSRRTYLPNLALWGLKCYWLGVGLFTTFALNTNQISEKNKKKVSMNLYFSVQSTRRRYWWIISQSCINQSQYLKAQRASFYLFIYLFFVFADRQSSESKTDKAQTGFVSLYNPVYFEVLQQPFFDVSYFCFIHKKKKKNQSIYLPYAYWNSETKNASIMIWFTSCEWNRVAYSHRNHSCSISSVQIISFLFCFLFLLHPTFRGISSPKRFMC